MTWRYLARRVLTGEWLHLEVPLVDPQPGWALSAAGALTATIAPDVGQLRAADGQLLIDEWGTLLYAEVDGEIRWGGVVTRSRFEGAQWKVEAAGVATYPHGLPFLGEIKQTNADPANLIRSIWSHLQGGFPNGNLGVQVVGSTPARVGTTADPYTLSWWDAKDCGQEIDQLSREAPLEWVEDTSWADEQSMAVNHTIRIGYPRMGRRRDDLVFIQGDNVTNVVPVIRDGDEYANEIFGLGAGEGRSMVHTRLPVIDGRLRRTAVHTDKAVTSASRLDALCRDQLLARQGLAEIQQVDVLQHPNAPIGSWTVGDDVLVQADVPWLGRQAIWHRIVAWVLVGESAARLGLQRSDRFIYGYAPGA